jgi:inner membrane protein
MAYDWVREPDGLTPEGVGAPLGLDHPALAEARNRANVRAFLFWSRMPMVLEKGGRAYLTDQRFAGRAFPIGDEDGTAFRYDPFTVPLDSGDARP